MSEMLHLTPTWVFFVFFILLFFGYTQSKTRIVAPNKLIILPAAMVCLSMFSVWSAFGLSVFAYACWVLGIGVAQLINQVLRHPAGVQYDSAKQTLLIPGSLIPLALMMLIFFAKYFISASIATKFLTADNLLFSTISGFILGLCSGSFIARTRHMLSTIKNQSMLESLPISSSKDNLNARG